MFFYSHGSSSLQSTLIRENSGYYLDFNLPWSDGLDEKTIKAFEFYMEMFKKAPKEQVTLEFYFSQPRGIRDEMITERQRGFDQFDITFNPTKPDQLKSAVLSMIFWTSLDLDIFVAAKSGSKYFLYCDAFGLKDHEYVSSSGYGVNNLDGQFLWTDSSGDYTPGKYSEHMLRFKKEVGINLEDVIYIRGCHNYELSDKYDTMVEYAAHKYLKLFHFNKKYINGMIHDLRKFSNNAYLTYEQFEG